MNYEGRFVVWTHSHLLKIHTPDLTDPRTKENVELGIFGGWLGKLEYFDNTPLALYDMDRYGIDMAILLPSLIGTRNEEHAAMVKKHPDKFRACCMDTELQIKVWKGEAEWTIEACVKELDAALKTGNYVGIGEVVANYHSYMGRKGPVRLPTGGWVPGVDTALYTFEQRLNELRQIAAVAAKYDVPMYFHEYTWNFAFDPWKLLVRLLIEYPQVTYIISHGGYEVYMGEQLGKRWIQEACHYAGWMGDRNVYLECGQWPAEYWEIALKDPNIGPTRMIWGGEQGQICTHMTPKTKSPVMIKGWPEASHTQDYWGQALIELHKVKASGVLSQDEFNLILGGNAARVFKLPVPFERMFPENRIDLYGMDYKDFTPHSPIERVKNPDKKRPSTFDLGTRTYGVNAKKSNGVNAKKSKKGK